MIKFVNYFFQSIIIYSFFFIGRIIGVTFSRKIFSSLFVWIGPLFKSKKIINKNLNLYSNKITEINKEKIKKDMWKNYGKTFIEYIFLDQLRKDNSNFEIIGEQNLEKFKKNKKPVIFVSGHFANFELMSMEITKKNIPLATIYRPLNNFFLNPFMEYLRKKYICKNQIKKGVNGVRNAIDYIKKNHCIALMIDQRVSEGQMINFFDVQALTTTLPAQLSIRYDLNIIPVYIERKSNDKFLIEFQEQIDPGEYENKIKLTEKLNNVLETMINRNPGQWIWTHNRWK
jgi:KDO2-lipid IV(A) lauroyltransferase